MLPSPRNIAALTLTLAVLWPAPRAFCWTDATRARMIEDALKASPPSLRAVLEAHERRLIRGMLDPSRREGEEVHYQHPEGRGGMAAAGVAFKVRKVRELLLERRSLRRFVYEMGTLAHLVSDASFPLNVSDADSREPLYREAYRRYVEKVLVRIPFVLDRSRAGELEDGDVERFIMTNVRRAEPNYALIGPAYKDDGTPVTPRALDERSVPFGVASLAYSEAVTGIVLIWRRVWISVNGDMTGTPFLDDTPADRVTIPDRSP